MQRIIDRQGSGQRREDLAEAVCKSFGWRRPDGRLAIASCRLLLGRLGRRGLLRLPESLRNGDSAGRAGAWLGSLAPDPPAVFDDKPLAGALVVRPISDGERVWWRAHMDRYHYLGNCRMVGESLCYVAVVGREPVALLGWAASQAGPRAAVRSRLCARWPRSGDSRHGRAQRVGSAVGRQGRSDRSAGTLAGPEKTP